jgi:hypothetical protein
MARRPPPWTRLRRPRRHPRRRHPFGSTSSLRWRSQHCCWWASPCGDVVSAKRRAAVAGLLVVVTATLDARHQRPPTLFSHRSHLQIQRVAAAASASPTTTTTRSILPHLRRTDQTLPPCTRLLQRAPSALGSQQTTLARATCNQCPTVTTTLSQRSIVLCPPTSTCNHSRSQGAGLPTATTTLRLQSHRHKEMRTRVTSLVPATAAPTTPLPTRRRHQEKRPLTTCWPALLLLHQASASTTHRMGCTVALLGPVRPTLTCWPLLPLRRVSTRTPNPHRPTLLFTRMRAQEHSEATTVTRTRTRMRVESCFTANARAWRDKAQHALPLLQRA